MSTLDTHLSPPGADRPGPEERTSSSSASTSVDRSTSDLGLGAARRQALEPDASQAGWRSRPERAETTWPASGRVELRRRDSKDGRERTVPDRVRRRRRRNARLRRTAVVALTVLLAGTVVARWHEDPATILASGATVGALTAQGPAALDQGEPADDVVQGGTADGDLPGPPITTAGGSGATASAPANAPPAPAASVTTTPAAPSSAGATAQTTGTATAPSSAPSIGVSAPVPASTSVLLSGAGTFTPIEIPDGPVKSTGRTVTYGVDVEDGLPQSRDEFAEVVHAVLTDSRGWQTQDDVRFVPVSIADRAAGAHVDIRVTLASPAATQRLCAPLDVTTDQVSCWNGSRAVLNLTRWVTGAATYGIDLTSYRAYLVGHEVGHGLGYQHTHCPGPGQRAPIMVQQTKSLEGCVAWPWP
ncbi:MAG: DUF3152 domain-containing protein, partial [Actinomycetota bacterium]|nr:DUF3152 domain-containing protein [Actinomycetota bacterium]